MKEEEGRMTLSAMKVYNGRRSALPLMFGLVLQVVGIAYAKALELSGMYHFEGFKKGLCKGGYRSRRAVQVAVRPTRLYQTLS